jgi:tetratricopeptide (TPR) repeat protein
LDFGSAIDEFVDISSNSGLKTALDNASQVNDQTKILGALLDVLYALLPTQRIVIAGVLGVPDDDAAISLSLQLNGKLQGATTVSQPASGLSGAALTPVPPIAQAFSADRGRTPQSATTVATARDYEQLAGPAAVWIQFQVARLLRGDDTVAEASTQSFALLRQGMERHTSGEYAAAKLFYQQAIVLDARNWPARLNLASIELQLGQAEAALWVIRSALSDLEASPDDREPDSGVIPKYLFEPNYYRLRYKLAASLIHERLKPSPPSSAPVANDHDQASGAPAESKLSTLIDTDTSNAVAATKRLLGDAERFIRTYEDRPRWKLWGQPAPEVRLYRFLVLIVVPCAKLVLAGCYLIDEKIADAQKLYDSVIAPSELPGQRRIAPTRRMSYRVQYNLACYLSMRNDSPDMSKALRHLSSALKSARGADRYRLAVWARRDPSLETMRSNAEKTFNEILSEASASFSTSTDRSVPIDGDGGGQDNAARLAAPGMPSTAPATR